MGPHPRIRKTIKWGGAAVTALLVVVWGASIWCFFGLSRPKWRVQVLRGTLSVVHSSPEVSPATPEAKCFPLIQPGLRWGFEWNPEDDGTWELRAGLWLPLLASLLCTGLAWRLDVLARRRARVGLCAKCRYDRTGLAAAAVCPECGAAA